MSKDEQVCPKCGMERSRWSASGGFHMSGQQYCCTGCAQDTGCVCETGRPAPKFGRGTQPGPSRPASA